MAHLITVKVIGYHIDVYGHVNNARYLEFLEQARFQFIEDNPAIGKELGDSVGVFVTNINISYRQQAVIGDIIDISTEMTAVRSRSGTVHHVLRRASDNAIIATADVTFMLADRQTLSVIRFSKPLRQALELLVSAET